MMKRVVAVLCVLSCLLLLPSCKKIDAIKEAVNSTFFVGTEKLVEVTEETEIITEDEVVVVPPKKSAAVVSPPTYVIEEKRKVENNAEPIVSQSIQSPAEFTQLTSSRCFDALPDSQKKVYEAIRRSALSLSDTFYVPSLKEAEMMQAMMAFKADNPDVFWVTGSFGYSTGTDPVMQVQFSVDTTNREQAAQTIRGMQGEIQQALQQAQETLHGEMGEFERELALHDWLLAGCSYDTEAMEAIKPEEGAAQSESFNAYGALVKKRAVCEGYARAMQLLLMSVGIDAWVVIGEADVNDMWNIVKIGGSWYHLDPTWNDPANQTIISHRYFNLTDSEIGKDHKIGGNNFNPPACTATDYHYFTRNHLMFDDLNDSTIKGIAAGLVYAAQRKQPSFEIVFTCTPERWKEAQVSLLRTAGRHSVNTAIVMANQQGITSKIELSPTFIRNQQGQIILFNLQYN